MGAAAAAPPLLVTASLFNSIASSSISPLSGTCLPSTVPPYARLHALTPTNHERGSVAKSIERMSEFMSTNMASLVESVGGGGKQGGSNDSHHLNDFNANDATIADGTAATAAPTTAVPIIRTIDERMHLHTLSIQVQANLELWQETQ